LKTEPLPFLFLNDLITSGGNQAQQTPIFFSQKKIS
jgi:hypothetical protein